MGYKEDAELVVKHIDTMEKAGGSLLDKAGHIILCWLCLQQVPKNG